MQKLKHEHDYQLQELLRYSFLAKSTYEYHPRSRQKRYSDQALLSLIKVAKKRNPSLWLPAHDRYVKN
ncbi:MULTISPECIES: hypothetical protein [unclassified Lactobacillus]|uniref:hypothetical protein n=1 Tax=unclassified Lactobacillus TaxID=2620435 RepID=UPI000EFA89C1|nr:MULTISPECIES: hypothetical protein [unclassified Lactobacillus]RMC25059.1 hypothetical protein F5ESL0247_03060 [Lactobacillus sp. ESL0247]RMC29214.1 hypothetical protein F5ESL0246_03060 [Lactobacillus sp. ESL0246]RMC32817.1 hypothetical protein F5ESL0245_03060 [Lactobacillus sp. ESL0245]